MIAFFTPYEGKRPCLFVSYAHKTSEQVIPAIRQLHDMQYRVWYDEGIPAGADWPKNVAAHLRRCVAILFFISREALGSSNCFNEISAAKAQHKPIVAIALDASALPDRWAVLLEGAAHACPMRTDPESIAECVLLCDAVGNNFIREPGEAEDSQLGKKKARRFFWLFAMLFSLLLLSAAAGMFAIYMGWFPELLPGKNMSVFTPAVTPSHAPTPIPVPTLAPTLDLGGWPEGYFEAAVEFPDTQQERAVRAAIGQPEAEVYRRQLVTIDEMLFCGNMTLQSTGGIRIGANGECRVNGAPVVRGRIADLSAFASMPALSQLSLVYQQVSDISPLGMLLYLAELDLSLNPLKELGDLSGMKSLSYLRLGHTLIRDLSPLHALDRLVCVTVSADMFPMKIGSENPLFDLILVP
jgi:hypothetical protein